MSVFAVSICPLIWLGNVFAAGGLAIQSSPPYLYLVFLAAISFLLITSPIVGPLGKLYRAASFSYTRLFMTFLSQSETSLAAPADRSPQCSCSSPHAVADTRIWPGNATVRVNEDARAILKVFLDGRLWGRSGSGIQRRGLFPAVVHMAGSSSEPRSAWSGRERAARAVASPSGDPTRR